MCRPRTGRPPPRARGVEADRPSSRAARQSSVGSPTRLCRRDEQQALRLVGQRFEPAAEHLFEPVPNGSASSSRSRRRAASGAKPAGKLQQCERVPARLREDPVAHGHVQRGVEGRRQAARAHPRRPDRRSTAPAARQARRVRARGEDQRDGLRQQAAGDERECLPRGLVEPLRVVDQADQRSAPRRRPRAASARPARRGSGPACRPPLSPNAVASASRWGPGRRSSRPSIGAHSWCNPANASSLSASTPAALATRQHAARLDTYSNSAVFPTPASPRRTSTRLSPAPDVRDQPVQCLALAAPAAKRGQRIPFDIARRG